MLLPKQQFANEKGKKGPPISCFRLSEEIKILIKIIYDALKSLNIEIKHKKVQIKKEEFIQRQILGLLFKNFFRKAIENFEIYLFPYLKSGKLNIILVDSLRD